MSEITTIGLDLAKHVLQQAGHMTASDLCATLLWVAGLGRRFERPNTGQRNRRGLSAAADALKPPIELSRLDLMCGVLFAHWVLAYISGSIPSRSTIPTSAIALSEGQLSMKLDSMASNGDEPCHDGSA
jgi:hypothetical protein